jgi:hypothetical protein
MKQYPDSTLIFDAKKNVRRGESGVETGREGESESGTKTQETIETKKRMKKPIKKPRLSVSKPFQVTGRTHFTLPAQKAGDISLPSFFLEVYPSI